MTIRFKFAASKARAAIHWIVAEHHNVDLHAGLKACYFADKSHLNEHGRPIFGATYKAMKFGPVPLEIYEMMKGEVIWLIESGVPAFPWRIDGHQLRSIDNSHADVSTLSETDLLHLASGLDRSRQMTFNERTAATHGPDWQKADLGLMDYADMIDEGPDKAGLVAYLEANSRYMRL
jgi:uncharacterized phage-associated protein